jgi:hypothetical protein
MANDIIPQELIIYRRILTDALNKITNEMYASNQKMSFKHEFVLIPNTDRPKFLPPNKTYYLFRIFVVDKTNNIVGDTHYLYNNYYPKDALEAVHIVEKRAIQEWFTNASKALYNHIHEAYMQEVTVNKNIADDIAVNGATMENVKKLADVKGKEFVENREKELMGKLFTGKN